MYVCVLTNTSQKWLNLLAAQTHWEADCFSGFFLWLLAWCGRRGNPRVASWRPAWGQRPWTARDRRQTLPAHLLSSPASWTCVDPLSLCFHSRTIGVARRSVSRGCWRLSWWARRNEWCSSMGGCLCVPQWPALASRPAGCRCSRPRRTGRTPLLEMRWYQEMVMRGRIGVGEDNEEHDIILQNDRKGFMIYRICNMSKTGHTYHEVKWHQSSQTRSPPLTHQRDFLLGWGVRPPGLAPLLWLHSRLY